MRRLLLPFLLFCSVFFPSLSAQAASTYRVDPGGNDANSGTFSSPFGTIQKGLNVAQSGDTVLVNSGTYAGTGNRDLTFGGKNIVLRSTNGAGSTIIDCGGSATEEHRGFNVVNGETAATVIQGFTVTNGYVKTPANLAVASGSAILTQDASPTIRDCIFRSNTVGDQTGPGAGTIALYSSDFNTPSTATLTNCLFTANQANFGGAAVFAYYSNVSLTNCTISGNTAENASQGGTAIYGLSLDIKLRNCIVYGNTGGSPIYNPATTNSAGFPATTVTYSDIEGGYGGEGNINADPKFVSSTDLRLQKSSPALNTGTSTEAPGTDLLGVARPQGGTVDMGAYEFNDFTESLMVTTLQDESNVNSDPILGSGTSLREAITYAKSHTGADAITFAPNLNGTINLLSALPFGLGELSINANANQSITINRASDQNFNFFKLTEQDKLTLQNLTFTNGRITNSDGGAIRNEGILTVNNCTFQGNSAFYDGGAIYNRYGTLTISNSTLIGNSATVNGGGISNVNGIATITNCTITGNKDTGGAGGIFSYSSTTTNTKVSNSIVQGNNQGVEVPGDVAVSTDSSPNTFTSLGYNLIGTGKATGAFSQTGDKTGVTSEQLKLGYFGNNGGPTSTVALKDGSNAINAGNTDLTTDQRGTARPQGGADDIGAFEFNTVTDGLVVTTLSDEYDGTNDSSVGTGRSLREAIITATLRGQSAVITFAPNLNGTITIGDTLPSLLTPLEIQGPTNASIAISGNNAHYIFLTGNEAVKISNLTLSNGYTAHDGGAMTVQGPLTMENCTFVSNSAARGGAIFINSASGSSLVTLRNCTFSGNSATQSGGAIYNDLGLLDVRNCTISSNTAPTQGGGIGSDADDEATTTISNSIVAGNTGGDLDLLAGTSTPFSSGGYNLIGQGNGASAFNQPGDKVIGAAAPGLAALANNGGPTQTRALIANSPAINAGDPAFAGTGQTDQRGLGFPRIKSGRLDIGAFESAFDSPAVPVILTPRNNQSVATVAFKSITGTASDNLSVVAVQLKLFRTRGGVTQFWNGSAFTTTQTLLDATLSAPGSPTTNWTYAVSPALSSALDVGAYSVAAYAKDSGGTTSAAVGSNFTLFIDTTAPVPVITTPANNQNLSSAGFTAVSGTATDNSNVAGVQIKLFRTRSGVSTFWNGSAFTSTQTLLNATLASPGAASTAWTYPVTPALRAALDNGAYSVVAYAKDASGNSSGAIGRNFTIDNVLPAVAVTSPTQNQSLPLQSLSISGTATDNAGVGQVQIKLFRVRGGVTQFWNGSAFTTTDVRLPTTLSTPNGASTNWTYTVSPALRSALDSGAYNLVAYAIDTAGNSSAAAGRNFTTYSDTSLPGVTISTPNQNQPLSAATFTSITGSATDNIGVTRVQFKLFRSRNGVIEYWNGTTFTTAVALLDSTLTTPGATSTGWSYTVPAALRSALDVGTYNLVAYAKDAANNQSAGVGRTFIITTTSSALKTPPTSVSGQSF